MIFTIIKVEVSVKASLRRSITPTMIILDIISLNLIHNCLIIYCFEQNNTLSLGTQLIALGNHALRAQPAD